MVIVPWRKIKCVIGRKCQVWDGVRWGLWGCFIERLHLSQDQRTKGHQPELSGKRS